MKLTIQENGYSDGLTFSTEYRVDPVNADRIISEHNLTEFDWVSVYLPKYGLDFTVRPLVAREKLLNAINALS